jgi:hypothetical protein
MERAERFVLLGACFLAGSVEAGAFVPALWVYFGLTLATAVGRFWRVWQVAEGPVKAARPALHRRSEASRLASMRRSEVRVQERWRAWRVSRAEQRWRGATSPSEQRWRLWREARAEGRGGSLAEERGDSFGGERDEQRWRVRREARSESRAEPRWRTWRDARVAGRAEPRWRTWRDARVAGRAEPRTRTWRDVKSGAQGRSSGEDTAAPTSRRRPGD